MLNSAGNSSGPSIGASSLVTDANSALSGGPQLQRSASINNESYTRLPASPMSFSSNSIAGSPVMESSIVQQSPHQEGAKKRGASASTSQIMAHDATNPLNAQKKPRIDARQEDILQQQQLIRQHLQRHEAMQPSGQQNVQLQTMFQHQRLVQRQQQQQQQQQQLMQSLNHMPRAPLSLQQQQQLRQQLQQQAVQLGTPVKHPLANGICSRRLMQYLFHQRHHPQDNTILYWRKFVAEYFAPMAKKRMCLSVYHNIGNHGPGTFRQAPEDAWHCDMCGSKSGKGIEATVEVLPRLCQIKFDGVMDESLFLDMPHENRLPSGLLVLEYAKAVQESVYEHLRVVREGQLRIVFTQELKILSWEFCVRRHDEFLPRRLLTSQVNQLMQVAQKYQNTVDENGTAGVPHQNLQATCDMFVTAGCQLAKSMESQSLNELGFSKRYDRCLQIYEVVKSMKSLIDFSQHQKIGPIESLKYYSRLALAELQKQKMHESEQLMSAHTLPPDLNSLRNTIGLHQELGRRRNNNVAASGVPSSNQQNVVPLNNYKTLTLSPNQYLPQQEASNHSGGPKQAPGSQFYGSAVSILTNSTLNGLPQHQQQPPSNGCQPQHNNLQPSHLNQHMLQQTVNNNIEAPQYFNNISNTNGTVPAGVATGVDINDTTVKMVSQSANNGTDLQNISTSLPNSAMEKISSRSNSSKSAVSNRDDSGNTLSSSPDSPLNLPDLSDLSDLPTLEILAQGFEETGLFDDW